MTNQTLCWHIDVLFFFFFHYYYPHRLDGHVHDLCHVHFFEIMPFNLKKKKRKIE